LNLFSFLKITLSCLVHIIDRDAQVRAVVSGLLASHGFAPRTYAEPGALLREEQFDGDCVLLDLGIGDTGSDDVQKALRRRGMALPVIVMSGHGDLAAAVRAMKLGAVDVLQKPVREEELLAAIERALEGFRVGQGRRRAAFAAATAVERLSPRERQVLQGLLSGLTNKAIARRLGLSPRTVEMHRANMMNALGAVSLPEALRLAIDAQLQPLDSEGVAPRPPEIAALDPPGPAGPDAIRRLYEEKLRLALEASGDGAWDWDMVGGRIEISRSLIERIGLAWARLPDRLDRLEALMHPLDRGEFRLRLDEHLEGRSAAFACEYRLRNRGGEWRWIEVRGRVVERDPSTDAPLRMVGTGRDVSARKAAEARAREAAELLALAQLGAAAGTWEIDLDSGAIRLCGRGRELNGIAAGAPEDVLTLDSWSESVHPADFDGVMAAIKAAARTGEPAQAEFRVRQPDGSWRRLRAIGKVVGCGPGERPKLVGLTQDADEPPHGVLDLAQARA
jgi:PAS domain S-box-containing protein